MGCFYLYAAVLCGVYALVTAHSCQVSDIEVQPNFDITRMSGRWYEIKWTAFKFIPEEYRFRDYEHWYMYNEDTKELDIRGHGRSPGEAHCFYYKGSLIPTETPGRLIYRRPAIVTDPNETMETPYWIISTDYDNYALTYYCASINSNGTCSSSNVKSWVWGRKPWLSSANMRMIDDTIQHLCVDPGIYMETPHDQECPMMDGTRSIHKTGFTLFVVALSLWMIH